MKSIFNFFKNLFKDEEEPIEEKRGYFCIQGISTSFCSQCRWWFRCNKVLEQEKIDKENGLI